MSAGDGDLQIVNCGGAVVATADGSFLPAPVTEVRCHDGLIVDLATGLSESVPDPGVPTLDAAGLWALPGLIDGHVHPVVGGVSVVPPSFGWTSCYLGAGVTRCVSAGELTLPGLRSAGLDPELVTGIACTSARLFAADDSPMTVHAGTLLAVPGLLRSHLAQVSSAGGRCIKFIYYPFDGEWEPEVRSYVQWAHELGLTVKMHAGGSSFRGESVAATASLVAQVQPDVLAHANGGPIPMSDADIRRVIEEMDCYLEVILGGNLRLLAVIAQTLRERDELHRLVVGTDTPGGNGLMPRGVMQAVAALASLGGLDPWSAWRCASENVARAHGVPGGTLSVGSAADIVLAGPIAGSSCASVDQAICSGELVGLGAVVCGGRVVQLPGAYLPPPAQLPRMLLGGREVGC